MPKTALSFDFLRQQTPRFRNQQEMESSMEWKIPIHLITLD